MTGTPLLFERKQNVVTSQFGSRRNLPTAAPPGRGNAFCGAQAAAPRGAAAPDIHSAAMTARRFGR